MSAGRKVNTKSQNWNTPPKYVDAIKHFFGGSISLDPCSNDTSIVGADTEFKLPAQDGLLEDWERYETVFVNPPYGRDRERGTPVATNTNHWKKWVFGKASCVCFLYDTRLKFLEDGVESKKGAPMACALVYWGNMPKKFVNVFSVFGAALDISEVSTPMGDRP